MLWIYIIQVNILDLSFQDARLRSLQLSWPRSWSILWNPHDPSPTPTIESGLLQLTPVGRAGSYFSFLKVIFQSYWLVSLTDIVIIFFRTSSNLFRGRPTRTVQCILYGYLLYVKTYCRWWLFVVRLVFLINNTRACLHVVDVDCDVVRCRTKGVRYIKTATATMKYWHSCRSAFGIYAVIVIRHPRHL